MTATALRGRVLTGTEDLADAVVLVEGDRITGVLPADQHDGVAEPVPTVLPGLVDLHCHGGGGASFTSGSPDEARAAARHHRGRGTTTLVGSTVSDAPDRLLEVVGVLAALVDEGLLAGIHLEGPFLSSVRCGAQDPRHLRTPDEQLTRELLAAGRGHVRIVTIAPELPGAADLAALLREQGVLPAAGHTDADAAVVREFLGAGGHVTHLFNGMPPFHHRAAGPAGAALGSAATLELIGDGVHLDDEVVTTVLRLAGGDRVCFVSDAMAAAGMPDGDYVLGPQDVQVVDGVARLREGGSIAGGTASLSDIVARQLSAGLVEPVDVVAAATRTPARVLGVADDRGGIAPGRRADLVVLDDHLQVVRVLHAGAWVG